MSSFAKFDYQFESGLSDYYGYDGSFRMNYGSSSQKPRVRSCCFYHTKLDLQDERQEFNADDDLTSEADDLLVDRMFASYRAAAYRALAYPANLYASEMDSYLNPEEFNCAVYASLKKNLKAKGIEFYAKYKHFAQFLQNGGYLKEIHLHHVFPSELNFPCVGTIKQNDSGFIYLKVSSLFVERLLPLIRNFGYVRYDNEIGAHITLIRAEDANEKRIRISKSQVQSVSFKINRLMTVEPKLWRGVSLAAILCVR